MDKRPAKYGAQKEEIDSERQSIEGEKEEGRERGRERKGKGEMVRDRD